MKFPKAQLKHQRFCIRTKNSGELLSRILAKNERLEIGLKLDKPEVSKLGLLRPRHVLNRQEQLPTQGIY